MDAADKAKKKFVKKLREEVQRQRVREGLADHIGKARHAVVSGLEKIGSHGGKAARALGSHIAAHSGKSAAIGAGIVASGIAGGIAVHKASKALKNKVFGPRKPKES